MNIFQKITDIRASSDPLRAIESITEGVSIRGYNMWLLFCSAVLASIGLDTGSSAVIIGAMLISPLMSPILGVGLSLGTHDRNLLLRSLKNLVAAIALSLIASYLYFSVSPFAYPNAELQARTYPTLLDILVALFGGIAGIVSVSRSGTSIALPGVAIATALMPPLCTAGYGLATQRWMYFGGAFYLFFINAVFISLATFLIVKYLHFPQKPFASRFQRHSYTIIFSVIVVMVTIPSIYFLYTVYERELTKRKLNDLVFLPIAHQGNEILKWELEDKDSTVWVKVYHSGRPLGDSIRSHIHQNLAAHRMNRYELKLLRVNLTREEVNELSSDISRQMFQQLQLELLAREAGNKPDTLSYTALAQEVRAAFPFVDTVYHGWMTVPDTLNRVDTLPIVFYRAAETSQVQDSLLYRYLKVRLRNDTVVMMRQAATP
ncbi:MAG TPA: DUF389 domain-containing protein [Flavisolibacter sp.]